MAEEREPLIKIIMPIIGSIIAVVLSILATVYPKYQFPLQLLVSSITTRSVTVIFLSNGIQRNERNIILTI
jgi:hypothetical protein